MDTQQIQELSELFEKKGLTKMEICEGDTKVLFEKKIIHEVAPPTITPMVGGPAIPQPAAPQLIPVVDPTLMRTEDDVDFNNLTEVKSPMVGVFYSSPNPDSEPFVSVGSKVKKGDVLCIIEAMKLMNEIVAEVDGEIADVCAENGQVVEFSQTLFKIF